MKNIRKRWIINYGLELGMLRKKYSNSQHNKDNSDPVVWRKELSDRHGTFWWFHLQLLFTFEAFEGGTFFEFLQLIYNWIQLSWNAPIIQWVLEACNGTMFDYKPEMHWLKLIFLSIWPGWPGVTFWRERATSSPGHTRRRHTISWIVCRSGGCVPNKRKLLRGGR